MIERFTEDYYDDMQKIIRHCVKSDNIDLNCGGDDFQDIIDRLAEYEIAENENRLFICPVKPYDDIYIIDQDRIFEASIDCYQFYVDNFYIIEVSYIKQGKEFYTEYDGTQLDMDNLGEVWFLTREEAEKALEKKKEKLRKLTKKRAIQEHRKMWNWIADQYERDTKIFNECSFIEDLQRRYIDLYYNNEDVLRNCFCCEYTDIHDSGCEKCPIDWNSTANYSMCVQKNNDGQKNLYWELYFILFANLSIEDRLKCAQIARQIANLPERK